MAGRASQAEMCETLSQARPAGRQCRLSAATTTTIDPQQSMVASCIRRAAGSFSSQASDELG